MSDEQAATPPPDPICECGYRKSMHDDRTTPNGCQRFAESHFLTSTILPVGYTMKTKGRK